MCELHSFDILHQLRHIKVKYDLYFMLLSDFSFCLENCLIYQHLNYNCRMHVCTVSAMFTVVARGPVTR